MEVAHNALIYSELLCVLCRHRGPSALSKMLMVSWKERVSGIVASFHLWVCFDVGGVFRLGLRFGLGMRFGLGFIWCGT